MKNEEAAELERTQSAEMESGLMKADGLRQYLDMGAETEDVMLPASSGAEGLKHELAASQAYSKSFEAKSIHLANQLLTLQNQHASGSARTRF